jgi:hypothetical protein
MTCNFQLLINDDGAILQVFSFFSSSYRPSSLFWLHIGPIRSIFSQNLPRSAHVWSYEYLTYLNRGGYNPTRTTNNLVDQSVPLCLAPNTPPIRQSRRTTNCDAAGVAFVVFSAHKPPHHYKVRILLRFDKIFHWLGDHLLFKNALS